MRDTIFRLKAEHTCQLCYNPIGTTFMGSSVGYDLFRYWANYKNYYEKFENNRLFYKFTPDKKSYKACKACFKNRDLTVREIYKRKITGKFPYHREYSMTKDEIKNIWSEFISDVTNKEWFLLTYMDLSDLYMSQYPNSYDLWQMFFTDIYLYYHNNDESFDVYDLEEFDTFQLWRVGPKQEEEIHN